MSQTGFQSIRFGASDAFTEFNESPGLLRDGYYDFNGVEDKLVRGRQFIVLGYKGAGKSMVAARFRTLATDSPGLYSCPKPVTVRDLALADLKRVIPDSFEAAARAQWSWVLYLCVSLLEGIEFDGKADATSKARVREALEVLRSHQIISKSPRSLTKFKTTKMTTKISFPKFAEQTWEFDQRTSDQTIHVWIKFMVLLLQSHESPRRHFLFVDGLDDLGPLREGHATLLGGLVAAAHYINQHLQEGGAPIKVVVCARTDLYERLDLATKGKLRTDFGIELNWYQDPRDVERTHLVRLAQLRAERSKYRGRLFGGAFPQRLDGQETIRFLGQATRHTPRDFLSLLRWIQESAGTSDQLTRDQILAGMRQYSMIYLIGEMDDALDSYLDPGKKQRVLDAVGRLRSANFTKADFAAGLASSMDVEGALEALFETGFIGTVDTSRPTETYYRFISRNPAARISNSDSFFLHAGLQKAYNLT